MSKPSILLQLDTDPQPSVFDSVVAIDAGAAQLLRHGGITPENVRELVHGAMFTRGGDDLKQTAIFIGGSDVAAGERLFAAVQKCFFGPVRVSLMLDSNGANTTAAAAVLAAAAHVPLAGCKALVLAATGPVGARVVRLLAREGAEVLVASRSVERARSTCAAVSAVVSGSKLTPTEVGQPNDAAAALDGVQVVVACGAAGVELLPGSAVTGKQGLKVAIDLNAVPPAGIGGLDVMDRAKDRNGVICYGAIGVGGTKMKIHKEAIRRLFTRNDQVLDAEEIFALGREVTK